MHQRLARLKRVLVVSIIAAGLVLSNLVGFGSSKAFAAPIVVVDAVVLPSETEATYDMHVSEAVNLTKITLKRSSGSFSTTTTSARLVVNGATINQATITRVDANTLVATIPGGVVVDPSSKISLTWYKGYSPVPALSALSASAEGNPISIFVDVNDPTAPANFIKINNRRDYDSSAISAGLITAKTYWGVENEDDYNHPKNIFKQGNVSVIQVQIDGVQSLEGLINTADSRLALRVGNSNNRRTFIKDIDYTISVFGNSVFFHLKNPVERAQDVNSFDWDVTIPYSGTGTSAKLYMWHEGPSWYNRNAPAWSNSDAQTPRNQLTWLPQSTANPQLLPKCGGDVALLLDLSGSVLEVPGAMNDIKTAGETVIDALKGTGSTLSIYNFASAANTFPAANARSMRVDNVNDEQTLHAALNAVASFQGGNQRRQDTRSDGTVINGGDGTNWQDAFKQIPSASYDYVIFVTDGVPTTSNRDYPNGYDPGDLINKSDLALAVPEANRLKESGTRIETIMVGVPSYNEHIPDDNYFSVTRFPGDLPESQLPENQYGYPSLYGFGKSVPQLLNGGGQMSIWAGPGQENGAEYNVTNQTEIWRVGVRSSTSMAADVSGLDAVHELDGYSQLAQTVRELVLNNCQSAVSVEKRIRDYVDDDGSEKAGAGWTFSASDLASTGQGSANLSGPLSGQTSGDPATISFPIDFSDVNGSAALTITETTQEGWTLVKQGTNNALCKDENNPNAVITTQNVGEFGFRVNAITGDSRIHCVVINERRPSQTEGYLWIRKVAADELTTTLDAGFTIYPVNQDETIDTSKPINVEQSGENQGKFKISEGRYAIQETQAPNGYSLLPGPVYFEIANENGSQPKAYLLQANANGQLERVPGRSTGLVDLIDGKTQNPPENQQGAFGDNNGTFTIQVADVTTGNLPLMGGRGVIPAAIAGLILAIIAIGFAVGFKRS